MNKAAIDDLLTSMAALERAFREEKMEAAANLVRGYIANYHKLAATPPEERLAIDWRKFAAQISDRAGMMAQENAALPPAARNTPFGVMTGTATLILSFVSEAIGVAQGEPPDAMVDDLINRIRSDRGAFVLAKLGIQPQG